MKRILLFIAFAISAGFLNAQSWTKISSNFDSLWTSSVTYYNKGDTIIHYGSTTGTGSFDAKRFYVSQDGGYTYSRDFTNLDAISLFPIVGLPINNMIIGFKNTPNDGSYSFQGLNNWASVLPSGTGIYGEVDNGTLLWNAGSGSTTLRTLTPAGANLTIVASGAAGIDLISTYNIGNRLLLGGGTANIKYVDNGNFTSIQSSTITPAITGSGYDVVRFFKGSGNNLYAVINSGFDKLYNSTDNGVTWTLQSTTWDNGGNITALNSNFIIGTPNGNIFFLKNGTSDDVFLSTDGGATATKIPNGLPADAISIGPLSKLLVNGNKVWYQVKAANTTDFVRTDTSKAGLYLFNDVGTGMDDELAANAITVYPNPATTELNLQVDFDYNLIEVYTIHGQLKQSYTSSAKKVDVSLLEDGLYILVLTDKRKQKSIQRFVKLN